MVPPGAQSDLCVHSVTLDFKPLQLCAQVFNFVYIFFSFVFIVASSLLWPLKSELKGSRKFQVWL